ncbi:hypothetical protein D9M69_635840 [compost metagenome]
MRWCEWLLDPQVPIHGAYEGELEVVIERSKLQRVGEALPAGKIRSKVEVQRLNLLAPILLLHWLTSFQIVNLVSS